MTAGDGEISIEVRVLDQRLEAWGLPRYQTAMAAAIDLFACVDRTVLLHPHDAPVLISSGLAIHIADPGMAALILPRSGLGHNKGLVLGNLTGLIDSDYLGPVYISAWNRSAAGTAPIEINPGDRIAQMMFVPVIRPRFTVVAEFSGRSERGTGGFGSTGSSPG
jgi:dUTP pyrophosphatase